MKISRLSIVVFVLGVLSLLGVYQGKREELQNESQVRFHKQATKADNNFSNFIHLKDGKLESIVGFFLSSSLVEEDEFQSYLSTIFTRGEFVVGCFHGEKGEAYAYPRLSKQFCEVYRDKKHLEVVQESYQIILKREVRALSGQTGVVTIVLDYSKYIEHVNSKSESVRFYFYQEGERSQMVELINDHHSFVHKNHSHNNEKEQYVGHYFFDSTNARYVLNGVPARVMFSGHMHDFVTPLKIDTILFLLFLGGVFFLTVFIIQSNFNREAQMNGKLLLKEQEVKQQYEQILASKKVAERSAKLASIGEIAAGVGHEINNPLTIIKSYTEILAKANGEEKHKPKFERILLSVDRIRNIVDGLRSYAREDSTRAELFDVVKLLEETTFMLSEIYASKGVELVFANNFQGRQVLMQGIRGKIQQVIVNLIGNANDAILQTGKHKEKLGKVELGLEVVSDEKFKIIVKDNGTGIDADLVESIFEPFFTTKPVGKGTGMGLSLSAEIVQEHEGLVEVDSQVGEGTSFILTFPLQQMMSNKKAS